MKNLREILDLRHRKALRIGILILTTLLITSASALVYASMIYEKALDVGNTSGVPNGSSSTAPTGVNFLLATILILALLAFVVGLSIFGFLREARKHVRNPSGRQGSLPTSPGSTPPREEEWEESPRKEEESSASASG